MSNTTDAREKEQAFRDSARILEKLAADHPNAAKYRVWLADSQRALGELYAANKRFDEADAAYLESIELGEKLAADYPKNVEYLLQLALRCHELANVLKAVGRSAEAEQRYRDALALKEKLVTDSPANPDFRFHLAHTDLGLAYLLAGTNRVDEAEQHFRKAVAIFEKLAADFPAQDNYRVEVGHVLWHLANHVAAAGRHEESEKHHRQALAVFEKLTADVPANAFYRMEQGYSHWNLGALLVQLGRLQDAADSYRSALMVYSKLAADFPGDTEYRSRRTRSYTMLIDVLLPLAQHAEAAKLAVELSDTSPDKSNSLRAGVYLEQCVAVAHKDESLSPSDRTLVTDAYAKQAAVLLSEANQRVAGDGQLENHLAWGLVTNPNPDLRAPARAVELSQKAVELAPLSGYIWNTLGVAHYRAGDWSAGITALEKSMELRNGGDSTDWFVLSMCLWQQGKQDRARTWYRAARLRMAIYESQDDGLKRFRAEAAALMGVPETEPLDKVDELALGETLVTASPTASSYRLRGGAFAKAEQWDRAAEDFTQAIELGDKSFLAWYERALVRLATDDKLGFEVACADMLKQFAQTEDAPSAHFAAWTCALGPEALTNFAPAVALAEKAAKIDATSPQFVSGLGAILYRAGRFDEARQMLEKADRLYSPADARGSRPAYTWFFLAMTHHRIGNADQAKKWLGKAREVTDKAQKDHDSGTATLLWNRRLTLKLLRQEAESLLGNEQSPAP